MTIFRRWCLNKPKCETSICFFYGYFWKHLFLRFADIILNKILCFSNQSLVITVTLMSYFCFDTVMQNRYFPQMPCHWVFHLQSVFFKCFLYQIGDTCQQCQKPFMIHLFNVKYGGVLLRGVCESRPPSYFLISCMPTTRLCHHIVISCSEMK